MLDFTLNGRPWANRTRNKKLETASWKAKFMNIRTSKTSGIVGLGAIKYKKLSYRPGTARCVVSVGILSIATQLCRNYLYDESWTKLWSWRVTVRQCVTNICTQPWRDRVAFIVFAKFVIFGKQLRLKNVDTFPSMYTYSVSNTCHIHWWIGVRKV